MSTNRESKFKLYSLGIAIENKIDGSDFLKINPIEEVSFGNGDISKQTTEYDIKTKDAKGVDRSYNVTGDNYLVAKWIPNGSDNRITSPDVVAGETVAIYRFADTDEYHWTTIFREPSLRRLETVCYAFGNISGKGTFNKESCYFLEISTKEKYLHLHTSKSDGEPFEYDIKIDTGTGTFSLIDDVGNEFTLNSANGSLYAILNTSFNVKTPTVNIEASNINLKGDIDSTGSIKQSGNVQITGEVNSTGNLSVTGNIAASGTVHGINI